VSVSGRALSVVAGLGIALSASAAAAQTVASPPMTAEQKQTRYQVGVMEQVLESAVEHGATVTLDRLQAVLPAQMGPAENARVRGFRLDGYGVFFDVEVPPLDGTIDGTLLWSLQTLDQNDLGLQNALKTLKEHLDAEHDPNLQQALKRVELQVAPVGAMARLAETSAGPARTAAGSAAARQAAEAKKVSDPILEAQESYHNEVMQAIMDAMLEHSGPLAIAPDEWLTIAARGHQDRPRLAPADSDSRTFLMRLNGATLKAFRAAQITKEDALRRIEVRVF
jgi:hypothetical protein